MCAAMQGLQRANRLSRPVPLAGKASSGFAVLHNRQTMVVVGVATLRVDSWSIVSRWEHGPQARMLPSSREPRWTIGVVPQEHWQS